MTYAMYTQMIGKTMYLFFVQIVKYKKVGVLPICKVKSNVSCLGLSL